MEPVSRSTRTLRGSGVSKSLASQGNDGIFHQENVLEFLKSLENFQNLEDFLDHLSLLQELLACSSQVSVSKLRVP